jgi:hypothetical protein
VDDRSILLCQKQNDHADEDTREEGEAAKSAGIEKTHVSAALYTVDGEKRRVGKECLSSLVLLKSSSELIYDIFQMFFSMTSNFF